MHNKAVLLVDDEIPILKSLGSYLERNDLDVTSAMSGEEAIAEFSSAPFDLVITDLVMSGMNGIDLLKRLKKINNEAGVFILTGHGNMSFAIEALRSGADDFILKPCDGEELVLKMDRFFEKQEAQKKVKIYEKYLPICMYCKKIRDDSGKTRGSGRWVKIEEYLSQKSGTDLTHGCCPECFEEHVGEWVK